ncbi:MAG: hypothetical protein JWQ78_376 [Sediminibacterium sp.]|nr:hypothetical protein [Sediminibacterium sp.]
MLFTFSLFGFSMLTGDFGYDAQSQTVKRKWSKRKKGAVIGGVAGAATGAIISKKKGKGALIGGVVGAGGGYLYGRHKEKKAIRRANGIH